MPSDNVNNYLALKGKMENLSKGIKNHASDQGFPANISAAAIESELTSLNQLRSEYDDTIADAHQKYDVYFAQFKKCQDVFSKTSTQLYGFHGKYNTVVEDYGMQKYQKSGGRKKKENPAG